MDPSTAIGEIQNNKQEQTAGHNMSTAPGTDQQVIQAKNKRSSSDLQAETLVEEAAKQAQEKTTELLAAQEDAEKDPEQLSNHKTSTPPPPPTDIGKSTRWSIEGMGGVLNTAYQLKTTAGDEEPLFILGNNTAALSPAIGGMGHLHLNNKWRLGIGLHYHQQRINTTYELLLAVGEEEEDGEEEDSESFSTEGFVFTAYNQNTLSFSMEENEDEEWEEGDMLNVQLSGSQALHQLSIPIGLSYEVRWKKVGLSPYLGGAFDLILANKLKMSSSTEEVEEISVLSNEAVRPYNVSVQAALPILYHANDQLSVFFRPAYSRALLTVNPNRSEKVYPYYWGANMGLRYNF